MANVKTITATTTESAVEFSATYQFMWFRNYGENDCYICAHSGIVASADDVTLLKAGEVARLTLPQSPAQSKAYIKAADGSNTVEVHAQNFSDCPFKVSGKGGESITIDPTPTQGSANAVSSGGVYTALQNVPQPVDYSTTEQNTSRKWIDGKPIYQKTFVPTTPATSWEGTNNSVDVSGLNIDTLINTEAQAQNKNNDNYYPLSMISTPLNTIVMNATKSAMLIYLGDNSIPTRVFNFTIQYTKTTANAE